MSNNSTILIIDDEKQIQKLLEITLKSNYNTLHAFTAKEGLSFALMHPPELIILDLGLPDDDGQNVLRKIREWYTGAIIILSVKSSEEEIVKALDNGANDYLTKPFRTGELLARIRSVLRQTLSLGTQQQVFSFDNFSIDIAARSFKINNELIKLTSTEFSLLSLLVRNEGKVLTHQYILNQIWGPGYIEQTQYLRVFVGQLRKKIEPDPDNPVYIITESGIGYRFYCKSND